MSLKRCYKCQRFKDTSEFHINRAAKDGLAYWCKKCQHIYNRSPAAKAARTRYAKTEKGRLAHAKAQRNYKSKQTSQEIIRKNDSKYRRNNPHKIKARNKIANEVFMGRMPSATECLCVHCGDPSVGYHHHKGYSEEYYLDVIPLCKQCDLNAHKLMNQFPLASRS